MHYIRHMRNATSQMLNLSRIFDLADSTKSYQFNLKLSNLVDSDVQSKAVTSRIKIGMPWLQPLSCLPDNSVQYYKKYRKIPH